MANGFQPGSPQARAFLDSLLAKRGVDVGAADRVFGVEGLSGGVGDGGHAFGPGQENDAGGVWTGRYRGLTPQQKNAIAWSPGGLTELADHVAGVARGQRGEQAVRSIVTRFERPADPNGEIAKALGRPAGVMGDAPQPEQQAQMPQQLGRGNPRTEFALAIAQGIGRKMDAGTMGQLVQQLHQGLAAEQPAAAPVADASSVDPSVTMKGGFAFPVAGGQHSFTNDWGNPRVGHTHAGIDIPAPEGTPLVAVQDGVVTAAGPSGAAGNRVWINGKFFYAHLSKFAVKAGDRVKAGQVIGYVGSTGDATGPHLHFGWSPDASQGVSWANPYQLLAGVAGGQK